MAEDDTPFSSNDIRLSPREWLVAAVLVGIVLCAAPVVLDLARPLDAQPDYRMPYRLSTDYWTFDRYVHQAADDGDAIFVVGDSVVWGHYVRRDQTLPACLNAQGRRPRFVNLGVDGIHPAALEGLIRYYGRRIRDGRVLLHFNPLWISSKKHDLQTDKEFAFNHPRLVPQFAPRIPCYRETNDGRLGIAIGRHLALAGLSHHLQAACFDQKDLSSWTLDHPYENPLSRLAHDLPSPDEPPNPPPVAESWTRQQIPMFNPAWTDLESSFQWRCFRETAGLLQRRGNRVFVLVGPFNEHMLRPESLAVYEGLRRGVEAWFRDQGLPALAPAPLVSEQYADASHPLADGYAALAQRLLKDAAFRRFAGLDDTGDAPE